MPRPRILLVPQLTELEWGIKPLLEEWAEVAAYDAPGVGREPPPEAYGIAAVVERGLAEIDSRGWDSCLVVGDEFGTAPAARLAAARPAAAAALALGHASLSYDKEGERRVIMAESSAVVNRLLATDYRAFMRVLTQATQGAYDDELAERFAERVPAEAARAYWKQGERDRRQPIGPLLRHLGVPLLLVEHKGCLIFTKEGYRDAVAAFPDARTASTELKPSMSPEFANALRRLCEALVPG